MEQNTTPQVHISVIIPVLDEGAIINDTIEHLRSLNGSEAIEIIVADGAEDQATLAAIVDGDVVTLASAPGRGTQMNAGAAMAKGRVLLFLHADTRLPEHALGDILWVTAGTVEAGAFSLSIDSPRLSLRIVAYFANMRSRVERVPYGDQAQFIRAETFRELGGFAEIPIMEDVELFQRIRHKGLPISILPGKVKTSSRRWDNEGVLRRTLTNWWLRIRYRAGASAKSLVKHYSPHDPDDHKADRP